MKKTQISGTSITMLIIGRKKKNTMEVIVLYIYIAICHPSFPSYLGTVYCIYKDLPIGICIMKVACTSKEVGLQSNCLLRQSEGRCFC